MKTATLRIDEYGPILDVEITTKFIYDKFKGINKKAPTRHFKAIIDTASTLTTLSKSVVKALKLKTNSTEETNTAAGKASQCIHDDCVIYLTDLGVEFEITPCSLPIKDDQFQILIGRDLLDLGTFLYDGENKIFKLRL